MNVPINYPEALTYLRRAARSVPQANLLLADILWNGFAGLPRSTFDARTTYNIPSTSHVSVDNKVERLNAFIVNR
jgi:TPR repeat protein